MRSKIRCIKEACKITDEIFSLLVRKVGTFNSEKDVSDYILIKITERGLKSAFPIIVASGKNASDPHHKPTKKKMSKGFCVVDFGVKVGGYCSDMTRTVFIGKPTKKDVFFYNLLKKTLVLSVKGVKTGLKYKELDLGARKIMGKYEKYFIHSLGHGVGRKVHQNPRINKNSKDRVKPGDVITIEPGIYIKNKLGIRVEECVAIKNNKIVVLTKSTIRLITIKS